MRYAIVLIFSLFLCSSLYADEMNPAIERATAKYSAAIVWMRYAAPDYANDGGITMYEREAPGVVVSGEGLIAMPGNVHYRDMVPRDFRLLLKDGTEIPAEYLGRDAEINIAFARLKTLDKLPGVLNFAKREIPSLGARVFAVSRFPPAKTQALKIDRGEISSTLPGARATWVVNFQNADILDGAPIFDENGEPLGILGYDVPQVDGGPAFGHPYYPLMYTGGQIALVKPVKPSEVGDGDTQAGWLGALFMNIDPELAPSLHLNGASGVYISVILPGSPAEKAGLLALDVIIEVDGATLDGESQRLAGDISALFARKRPGTSVELTIMRDASKITLTAELVARPVDANNAARFEIEELGLTLRPVTWDYFVYSNLDPEKPGLVVDRIVSGTPADLCELELDDLIVKVGGKQLVPFLDLIQCFVGAENLEPLETFVHSDSRVILMEVRRGARRHFLKLEKFATKKE